MVRTDVIVQKLSFRFEISGLSRFHSHHDLRRFFERAARRAGLEVRQTEGHNPRPRLVFPSALPVGTASRCEIAELEFYEKKPPSERFERLSAALAPTVWLLDFTVLPPVRKGRSISISAYRVRGFRREGLELEVERLLGLDEALVAYTRGDRKRRVNIRPWIESAWVEEDILHLRLRHSDVGAGRADDVCRWLASRLDLDWLELEIERTGMELK